MTKGKLFLNIAVIAAFLGVALFGYGLTTAYSASQSNTIPTISIVSVESGKSVTIKTANFPKNVDFEALIGKYGTLGVGGVKVKTVNSGEGGSLSFTFDIPSTLKDESKLAIRLQSASGYYAYNWFVNSTTTATALPTATATPKPSGTTIAVPTSAVKIPTFTITTVNVDKDVTIHTANFPANLTFDVRMGLYGTKGVNGTKVTSVSSGAGGALDFTFTIPVEMKGQYRVAIRLESTTGGYYSYNWFYNDTSATPTPVKTTTPSTTKTVTPTPTKTPVVTKTPAPTTISGYPRFSITAVVKDSSVTISATNFPVNDTFNVLMGAFGTKGVNGTKVTSVTTTGSSFTATYTIPDGLKGKSQIAIRLESPTSGFYAYNWFYNSTYP